MAEFLHEILSFITLYASVLISDAIVVLLSPIGVFSVLFLASWLVRNLAARIAHDTAFLVPRIHGGARAVLGWAAETARILKPAGWLQRTAAFMSHFL